MRPFSLRTPSPHLPGLSVEWPQASLPMDLVSRVMRAQQMNFDPKQLWFHGTTHDIPAFDPGRGSVENWLGRAAYLTSSPDDASANYASIYGPDIRGRIEMLADRLLEDGRGHDSWEMAVRQIAGPHDGAVMPVIARRDMNTLRLDKDRLDFGSKYDDDGEWLGDGDGITKFHEALQGAARGHLNVDPGRAMSELASWGVFDDGTKASSLDRALRRNHNLNEATDEYGNFALGEIIRRIYQGLGYDAVEMNAGATFPNMEGIQGARHLMVFDPKYLRSPFAAFDPTKKDSAGLLDAKVGMPFNLPEQQDEAAAPFQLAGDSQDVDTRDIGRELQYQASPFGKVADYVSSLEGLNQDMHGPPQGGGANVFGKLLGLAGLDESGARGATSWGEALHNTNAQLSPETLVAGVLGAGNRLVGGSAYPEKVETGDPLMFGVPFNKIGRRLTPRDEAMAIGLHQAYPRDATTLPELGFYENFVRPAAEVGDDAAGIAQQPFRSIANDRQLGVVEE